MPAWVAETLFPRLTVPPGGEAIVNVHYVLPAGVPRPVAPDCGWNQVKVSVPKAST